jgi:hypothetical protein
MKIEITGSDPGVPSLWRPGIFSQLCLLRNGPSCVGRASGMTTRAAVISPHAVNCRSSGEAMHIGGASAATGAKEISGVIEA